MTPSPLLSKGMKQILFSGLLEAQRLEIIDEIVISHVRRHSVGPHPLHFCAITYEYFGSLE